MKPWCSDLWQVHAALQVVIWTNTNHAYHVHLPQYIVRLQVLRLLLLRFWYK